MSQVLSDEIQQCLMSSISYHAQLALSTMAEDAGRPHVLMRPALSIDGNQWCALYGENLQDGVAGFGDSPAQAMADFDKHWHANLPKTSAPDQSTAADRGQG